MTTPATSKDAQASPVILRASSGQLLAALLIEEARIISDQLEIAGWHIGGGSLSLLCDGAPAHVQAYPFERQDLPDRLLAEAGGVGIGVRLRAPIQEGRLQLIWLLDDGRTKLSHDFELKPLSDRRISAPMPSVAQGWIEISACAGSLGQSIVAGWALTSPNVILWLETADNRRVKLESGYRYYRQDVIDVHKDVARHCDLDAGFLVHITDVSPGEPIRLMAEAADGQAHELARTTFSVMNTDPVAAARWIFGLATPHSKLYERFAKVDLPIISKLVRHTQSGWPSLKQEVHHLGPRIKQPNASIIVPLYGRCDFVEHQLMEFSRDQWLMHNVEIIYVLDDPALVEPFRTSAYELHKIYGIPFTWVWGQTNRGFSGANNLGATHARGDYLIFLNSDAFPQNPGWIESLLLPLSKDPRMGAIGTRLVFADGSIQHAAMQFRRRDDLGIWINHHPYIGLDPSLDPHSEITTVSAVTGACIAIRQRVFDLIGGWDTGYLIGDFEDSDLCLKLRTRGFTIGYTPHTQLTHLERQSFKALGDTGFRSKVVILNAVRHQTRWADIFSEYATSGDQ